MPRKKIHGNSKYKRKYTKELLNGLRDDISMSILAVCKKWGINKATYYNWIETYPEFAEAHTIGERDYHIQIEQLMIYNATGRFKGNAGVLNLMAKNMLGWKDKVEVESTGEKPLQKIEIEILQNKPALEQLDAEDHTFDADFEVVEASTDDHSED